MPFVLTDVVKNLLIINVLMYFGTMVAMGNERAILGLWFPGEGSNFQPYQIVTNMFMHANPSHLFMNMLSLFFLGPKLEMALGTGRFLMLYILAGLAGSAGWMAAEYYEVMNLAFTPNHMVWGASGAVFGVMAGYAAKFPNDTIMLIIPPIPVKAWILVAFMAVFELSSGVSGMMTGIAHFAHLAGGLMGLLLVLNWQRR